MSSTTEPKAGTVLLLALPVKTFLGINLSTFSSSPNFQGITNLAPGLHFLYTGTDASLSIRQGHWLRVPSGSQIDENSKTFVLRWNTDAEHLDLLPQDSADARNAVRGLQSLKRGLVDYSALREASAKLQKEQETAASRDDLDNRQDSAGKESDGSDSSSDPWTRLASHISLRLLRRVLHEPTPSSNIASSNSVVSSTSLTLSSVSTSLLDTETIPGLSQDETDSVLNPTRTLHILPIDLKKTWDESDLGSTRTERARDRSWYLQHLIANLQKQETGAANRNRQQVSQQIAAMELLGELQFTFLMVLCLANYSCLEQWKRLLSVMLTCQAALIEVEGFFVEVVTILRAQLGRVEDVDGGLFEMGDDVGSAWLRRLFRVFREHVDDAEVPKLKVALGDLETWLREQYQWADEKNVLRRGMVQLEDGEMVELQDDDVDEDEETGEYAPVIVEM